jgi:hypothetical protein
MSQLLFHRILPVDHAQYVSPIKIINEGITCKTATNLTYMNVGNIEPEIVYKHRPVNVPAWLDFSKAIGVDLTQKYSKSFVFPVFTNKIVIFDGDIVNLIYDQQFYDNCNSSFEEAENFYTGLTLNELFEKYWSSMMLLDDYISAKKYNNPQVLIFESIPKEIIKIVENNK